MYINRFIENLKKINYDLYNKHCQNIYLVNHLHHRYPQ